MRKLVLLVFIILIGTEIYSQNDCDCDFEKNKKIEHLKKNGRGSDGFIEQINNATYIGVYKLALETNAKWRSEGFFSNENECNEWASKRQKEHEALMRRVENQAENLGKSLGVKINRPSPSAFAITYKCISCNSSSNTQSSNSKNTSSDNYYKNSLSPIFDKRLSEEELLDQTPAPTLTRAERKGSTTFNIPSKQTVRTDIEVDLGDDLAMLEEEIPCINIGQYRGQDVCKKGDTIIVAANNKKYLLSRQDLLENRNDNGDYHAVNGVGYGIITEDGWYLGKDLNGVDNVIGYITTTSRRSNSTLYGEVERFARSSEGHRFYERKKEKQKQIGTLYGAPVYFDMLNTITTSKGIYDINKESKYTLKTVSGNNMSYFYIKEGYFIRAVIEIYNNYITPNTSSPYPVANVNRDKGTNTINVVLNKNMQLLEHLNRNQYNKPAELPLTHLKDRWYYDKNKCVWYLFNKNSSIYHNPPGQYRNIKLVRLDANKRESHETILYAPDLAEQIENNNLPIIITGTMVKTGEYQQTFNFYHSKDFQLSWDDYFKDLVSNIGDYFEGHKKLDVDLHNAKWIHYAEFPQNTFASPTEEELSIVKKQQTKLLLVVPYHLNIIKNNWKQMVVEAEVLMFLNLFLRKHVTYTM